MSGNKKIAQNLGGGGCNSVGPLWGKHGTCHAEGYLRYVVLQSLYHGRLLRFFCDCQDSGPLRAWC